MMRVEILLSCSSNVGGEAKKKKNGTVSDLFSN